MAFVPTRDLVALADMACAHRTAIRDETRAAIHSNNFARAAELVRAIPPAEMDDTQRNGAQRLLAVIAPSTTKAP